MKHFSSERGATLIELMIAISIILTLIAALLPTAIQVRKREMMWRQEIQLEQKAIRFFTYMENRNSNMLGWTIEGGSITIEVNKQRAGANIKRHIYKNGERIIERDAESGGNLILAQMVREIQYYEIGDNLHIELTLFTGDYVRVFYGVLSRSIEI